MLILGIDTAAAPCCAGLYDDEKNIILGQTVINNKLTHSVTLMPVIEDLLRNAEITADDIDLYAVSTGPGSFTGLRIGISAIKGMAFAKNKPCVEVTTTEAIAHNFTVADCLTDFYVCVAIDARCNQVFNALYKIEEGKVQRQYDDCCLKADELAEKLKSYSGKIILAGDGAEILCAEAEKAGVEVTVANPVSRYQTGAGVCLAAKGKKQVSPESIMPMYLKLPQAQRELMAKQGKEI